MICETYRRGKTLKITEKLTPEIQNHLPQRNGYALFFVLLSPIPRYTSKRYGRQTDRTYRKQHKKELGPESVHGFQRRELDNTRTWRVK